jgi:hypothetical protein
MYKAILFFLSFSKHIVMPSVKKKKNCRVLTTIIILFLLKKTYVS